MQRLTYILAMDEIGNKNVSSKYPSPGRGANPIVGAVSETLKDNAAEAVAMGVWGSFSESSSATGGPNENAKANKIPVRIATMKMPTFGCNDLPGFVVDPKAVESTTVGNEAEISVRLNPVVADADSTLIVVVDANDCLTSSDVVVSAGIPNDNPTPPFPPVSETESTTAVVNGWDRLFTDNPKEVVSDGFPNVIPTSCCKEVVTDEWANSLQLW